MTTSTITPADAAMIHKGTERVVLVMAVFVLIGLAIAAKKVAGR